MNMNLSGDEVKNYSHILFDKPIGPSQFKFEEGLLDVAEYEVDIKQALDRISSQIKNEDMRGENFSLPFLYFTTRKFKRDIEEFILNFQEQLARPGRNQ